ncbi:hypothetical protein KC359_g2 [Hortaea werneckii]|nr:hypothetical protein KC359_g2 [Hortaea werneckii]KAI7514877.1 hypothetical protein KC347_g2 [Hortaea werneckii]
MKTPTRQEEHPPARGRAQTPLPPPPIPEALQVIPRGPVNVSRPKVRKKSPSLKIAQVVARLGSPIRPTEPLIPTTATTTDAAHRRLMMMMVETRWVQAVDIV